MTEQTMTQADVLLMAAQQWDRIQVERLPGGAMLVQGFEDPDGFMAARIVRADGSQSDRYVTREMVSGTFDGNFWSRRTVFVPFRDGLDAALEWLRAGEGE